MTRRSRKSTTAAKEKAKANANANVHPAMAELSDFFKRAKAIARKLDAGQKIRGGRVVAIDD